MFQMKEYDLSMQEELEEFYTQCLPESGRMFDPVNAHQSLRNIKDNFEYFICLFDDASLIGTAAIRAMGDKKCELKSMYLYQCYHGRGLGTMLAKKALSYASSHGMKEVYLDTISKTSQKAIKMYHRLGFKEIPPYHEAPRADVFMKKNFK